MRKMAINSKFPGELIYSKISPIDRPLPPQISIHFPLIPVKTLNFQETSLTSKNHLEFRTKNPSLRQCHVAGRVAK